MSKTAFTIYCPDCPTNVSVMLNPDASEADFSAEMVQQSFLNGWLLVGEVLLCPRCAESRIDAAIAGDIQ